MGGNYILSLFIFPANFSRATMKANLSEVVEEEALMVSVCELARAVVPTWGVMPHSQENTP